MENKFNGSIQKKFPKLKMGNLISGCISQILKTKILKNPVAISKDPHPLTRKFNY